MAKKNTKPKQTIIEPVEIAEPKHSYRFKPKNDKQLEAWRAIAENDYTFLTGVAGGGKSFIPVAYAIEGVLSKRFDKIILSRPAVEAGENLGYLPGSAIEKVSPFLTPVFDAVEKITGCKTLKERISSFIEIVPLAYARGRTFERCFCILDEAQNAEPAAIEMYMTRLGEGSKMVLCGDDGQPDIVRCVLGDVAKAFHDESQAGWCQFTESVRHPRILSVIRIMEPFKSKVSRRRS